MKHFVAALMVMALIPISGAQAFQVLSEDQLANGIGVRGGIGFKDTFEQPTSPFTVEFNAAPSSSFGSSQSNYSNTPNWYGRSDGGGRYFGDSTSNHQNCGGGGGEQSNVSMLYSLNNGGGAYPCQRFR